MLLCIGTAANAQTPPTPPSATERDTLETRTVDHPPPASGPLLEGTVNRTEYILGPADVLTLSIFGFQSEIFTLTITPEGTVVIPTIGVVRIGGSTLNEAERKVANRVRSHYRDVEVRLSLAAVRSFKVFVVGRVPDPGSREATAVTRVSELIPSVDETGIARRNVLIRRADGNPLRADLARFLYLGELEQNPTLREGDVIQVPVVNQTVTVQGRVAFPGTYEYRAGESLANLLSIANGGGSFMANAADTLRLMRFVEDPRGEIFTIARQDAVGVQGQQLILQPFDAIFIPEFSHFAELTTARIEGEVVRPGTYPIKPGVTTVRDLVEIAGGFTSEASLLSATLRRQPAARSDLANQQLQNIPPEFLSEDERRILQVTSRADERNVVLSFGDLFSTEGSAHNVRLHDGDVLHIPESRNEIAVIGAVRQPGLVSYQRGQTVDEVVALAGGYANRADRGDVVVLKAKLGNRLNRRDVEELEPGDQIIVPFKQPATFMSRVREAESVMTTISGFVLAIVGLERLWDVLSN